MTTPRSPRARVSKYTDPNADHGPDGAASTARTSNIVTIGGRKRGVIGEQVQVRRYASECRVDQLNASGQLSDRQWRAAIIFRHRWRQAGFPARVTASYGVLGGGVQSSGDDQAVRKQDIRREVTGMLDVLGPGAAVIVSVCGEDQTCSRVLRVLQELLNVLADYLKVPADYVRGE